MTRRLGLTKTVDQQSYIDLHACLATRAGLAIFVCLALPSLQRGPLLVHGDPAERRAKKCVAVPVGWGLYLGHTRVSS